MQTTQTPTTVKQCLTGTHDPLNSKGITDDHNRRPTTRPHHHPRTLGSTPARTMQRYSRSNPASRFRLGRCIRDPRRLRTYPTNSVTCPSIVTQESESSVSLPLVSRSYHLLAGRSERRPRPFLASVPKNDSFFSAYGGTRPPGGLGILPRAEASGVCARVLAQPPAPPSPVACQQAKKGNREARRPSPGCSQGPESQSRLRSGPDSQEPCDQPSVSGGVGSAPPPRRTPAPLVPRAAVRARLLLAWPPRRFHTRTPFAASLQLRYS